LYLFFCAFSAHLTFAQSDILPRKVKLGARIEQTDLGIAVKDVYHGTAQNVKLKPGDIILEINQITIRDVSHLAQVLSNQQEGFKAIFIVLRKSKKIKLQGIFQGLPKEISDFSNVIYEQAPYRDGMLRVIINKPLNASGKLPAMLFIPGYTCSSIDNLSENHPYKRIIDAYVKAGFVTLRIEKSGLGDSYNTPPCESCDLKDEIDNFQAGLDKLKSLPDVDTNKIIIVGHSMGGIVAPALSAKNKVAGVVVYGTTAKSWFEYQIELARVQNKLAGLDPLEHEQSVRDQYDLNYRYFVKKESLAEIAKDSNSLIALIHNFQYEPEYGRIFGRNAEYWRQIQDINHLQNWKNTDAHVLVQFGESDFQAFSRQDHEQIVETCNYFKPGTASLQVFPLTDHYFAKSGTMQDAFDKFVNQQYLQLFNEYNHDVGNNAVQWSINIVNQIK
jgi:pimeloyl-ACP methyl ester carboxylesterase